MQAYQLKVTLVDSEPEVWRQIRVSAKITLKELHHTVQKVMGWENQHDYSFRQRLDSGFCDPQQSLAEILAEVLTDTVQVENRQVFYYIYDPNCGWLHRIGVELVEVELAKIGSKTVDEATGERSTLPVCLAGEAACPPESSGGVWGYDELLARLENTADPDYIDLIDQYGNFDPNVFDLAAANARLCEQP